MEKSAIYKLFKTAAIRQRHGESCKDLTLYEFCLFAESDKAAEGFQRLMQRLKDKMTRRKIVRKVSSVGLPMTRFGPASIMPLRDAKYVSYLPAAFNPLMNHFKEEETRTEMRKKVVEGLKQIDERSRKNEVDSIIEEDADLFKRLIASHFPKEDLDDQQCRKLFVRKKHGVEAHRIMEERLRVSLIQTRSSTLAEERHRTILPGTRRENLIRALNSDWPASRRVSLPFCKEPPPEIKKAIKSARKGIRRVFLTFKIEGKEAAQQMLRRMGNTISRQQLDKVSAAEESLAQRVCRKHAVSAFAPQSGRSSVPDLRRATVYNKETKRCLHEKLVLRKSAQSSTHTTILAGGSELLQMSDPEENEDADEEETEARRHSSTMFSLASGVSTPAVREHKMVMSSPSQSVRSESKSTLSYYTRYRWEKEMASSCRRSERVRILYPQMRSAVTSPSKVSLNIRKRFKKKML